MSGKVRFPRGYKNRKDKRVLAKAHHRNLFTKHYNSKKAKDYAFSLQSEDIINEDIRNKRLFRMFKRSKRNRKKEDKYGFRRK